jgi:hypothetical protein
MATAGSMGLLAGCMADGDIGTEEDLAASATDAISSQNSLSENALSTNKLSSNKLSSNKLSSNKLSSNSLEFNTAPNWDVGGGVQGETTPQGKELLRYLAKCALPAGVTLVNGADAYPGLLGLAPGWESSPLTVADQQKISACLGAHTNKFGRSVPISVRWDSSYSADEATYNYADAAFFGNYFADGRIYACALPMVPSVDSPDKNDRVCDNSNADCGFVITQYPCSTLCSTMVFSGSRKVFGRCKPTIEGQMFPVVMNVYLRSQ